MPKLKTFVSQSGFFESAVAAPTKKAAIELLGINEHAFKHGYARQTDDKNIVADTSAKPGVVLQRAIGSKGRFTAHAALPVLKSKKKPISHSKISKTKKLEADRKTEALKQAGRKRAEAERRKREAELKKADQSHAEAVNRLNDQLKRAENHVKEIESELQREEGRWQREKRKIIGSNI